MPIHSGKIELDSLIREVEFIPGNNTNINTTNFAFLKHTGTTGSTNWAHLNGEIERNPSSPELVGLDGLTPDPYDHIYLYGSNNTNMIGAVLIKDALMPGEKVTISGYFFLGKDPFSSDAPMNNTSASDAHLSVYYEDDWTEFSSFDESPLPNEGLNGAQTSHRRISGRGVVPISTGGNIGTVNGWMYSSGEDDTVFRSALPTASSAPSGMLNLSYFKDAGSGLSRFFKITIRNNSSNRARLKIYPQRGAGGSSSRYMGIYGLKAKFESTESERIEDPVFGHGIDFSKDSRVEFDLGVNRKHTGSESNASQYALPRSKELEVNLASDGTDSTSLMRVGQDLVTMPSILIIPFAYHTTDAHHVVPLGNTYDDSSLTNHVSTGNAFMGKRDILYFVGKIKIIKAVINFELENFGGAGEPPKSQAQSRLYLYKTTNVGLTGNTGVGLNTHEDWSSVGSSSLYVNTTTHTVTHTLNDVVDFGSGGYLGARHLDVRQGVWPEGGTSSAQYYNMGTARTGVLVIQGGI